MEVLIRKAQVSQESEPKEGGRFRVGEVFTPGTREVPIEDTL
jgi:hypothetical protein